MSLEEQADRLTINKYLKGGVFGGYTPRNSKVRKLFDFAGTKAAILQDLRRERKENERQAA